MTLALGLVWHILGNTSRQGFPQWQAVEGQLLIHTSLVKHITPSYGIDSICNHQSPCRICLRLVCKLRHRKRNLR